MMLATLPNGTPDGQLVLVSSDHRFCLPATGTATTLQDALERLMMGLRRPVRDRPH